MAAIVTPRTWADSDALNTSNLNAGVRDAILQLLPIRVVKSHEVPIVSNASLANDNDLVVSVAANADYEVTGVIKYTAAGGPGAGQLQIGWTGPAGCTLDWLGQGLVVNGASATTGSIAMDASTIATPRSYGAAGTGTACMLHITGRASTGGTAGSLQLQAAQVVSSVTATTIKSGSFLIVRQIA